MSNEKKLFELIGKIETLDEGAMAAAKQRQDYLAKPPGSLGKLEDISIKIAGISGKAVGNDVSKQCPRLSILPEDIPESAPWQSIMALIF